ncbi:MAG: hypothetical protein KatS3mg110_3603 [Pirellulaceae bacterium]|nr:MAG: hypothetical protein KatS3mg110_3603 [Pirellulaceae bacterium]
MASVRLLIGTKKGAFVVTSDGNRRDWQIEGPFFAGWEVYHLAGSPADPQRIYASQSHAWFGQVIQRSWDGGKSWETVDNTFVYEDPVGDHLWYDGTPRRWEFKRIWHFMPDTDDPDTVYAGGEDAALFLTCDGGKSWQEMSGLRRHSTSSQWAPGAGGMCLHTVLQDPKNKQRMYVAISAAGVFRSQDGGLTWHAANRGLVSDYLPDPRAEVGHCVHRLAMHPDRPEVLYMQKHWDVMRSDDGGSSWHEVSGNLPSDFGFPILVHPHDPRTVYVIPIQSDSLHFPVDGRLRVYRSRSGGDEWEPLGNGLPQKHCYVNVLREAMAADRLEPCGIYFGTTGGQLFASADEGESWLTIAQNLPAILSVEVQTLP